MKQISLFPKLNTRKEHGGTLSLGKRRSRRTLSIKTPLHLVVKGYSRLDLQNFFRVLAGHIAQELLRQFPILASEASKPGGAPASREKENKFWQTRIYSRVVSWGKEYLNVKRYVIQNELEALGLIPYWARVGRSPNFIKNTL